jgi:hypothetical protein
MKLSIKNICDRGHCTCFLDRCCGLDWSLACKRHDRRYENKRLTRYQADILLYRDVVRKTNCIALASLMFLGVRTFGWLRYGKN